MTPLLADCAGFVSDAYPEDIEGSAQQESLEDVEWVDDERDAIIMDRLAEEQQSVDEPEVQAMMNQMAEQVKDVLRLSA